MAAEYFCIKCTDEIPPGRARLGYTTCLACGEVAARQRKHCSAPLNKGNYILITNPELLAQLNPKRTT